ncbi:N-acetylglucosamine-1-phosphotransferase subunit gamma-like [Ciona intestinalis]
MTTLLVYCFVALFISSGAIDIMQMKIVNEVSNYGWNAGVGADSRTKLTAKVSPASFSGPTSLKALSHKCFSYMGDYKYELCPFHNLTQHERSMRWNPYSGVVGVWKEWEIANNTFKAMIMKNGDDCGSVTRQARVLLRCGTVNNITSVTEPSRCQYELIFETPLACHPDSMLVYVTMNASLRYEWDKIEQAHYNEFITEKGYNRKLLELFDKAGFLTVPEDNIVLQDIQEFTSVQTCNMEYQKLLSEITKLRKLNSNNSL